MKTFTALAVLPLVIAACTEANVTEPGTPEQIFDAPLDLVGPPSGGSCPNVYWESQELLDNGVTLTWRSVIGGFDYAITDDYSTVDVSWSLDVGSASFVTFGARNRGNTWTPKAKGRGDGVDGTLSAGTPVDGILDIIVLMDPMHRGDEDLDGDGVADWQGLIGNGHFWLILEVDDGIGNVERVKAGVNVHLEDPDDGFADRCPSG